MTNKECSEAERDTGNVTTKWETRQRGPTLHRDDLRLGGRTARQFGTLGTSLPHCAVANELFGTRLGGGSHTLSILTGGECHHTVWERLGYDNNEEEGSRKRDEAGTQTWN